MDFSIFLRGTVEACYVKSKSIHGPGIRLIELKPCRSIFNIISLHNRTKPDFSISPSGALLFEFSYRLTPALRESGQFSWNLEELCYTSKRVRVVILTFLENREKRKIPCTACGSTSSVGKEFSQYWYFAFFVTVTAKMTTLPHRCWWKIHQSRTRQRPSRCVTKRVVCGAQFFVGQRDWIKTWKFRHLDYVKPRKYRTRIYRTVCKRRFYWSQ